MHMGFHIGIPANRPIEEGEVPPPGKIIYGLESRANGLYKLENGTGFYGSEHNTESAEE